MEEAKEIDFFLFYLFHIILLEHGDSFNKYLNNIFT